MNEQTKVDRYFCNSCGGKTRHFIRKEHSATEDDEHEVVSFTQHLLIIECCGCAHLAFVRRTHFSEHIDYGYHPVTGEEVMTPLWEEAIYPPVTYRSPPLWFDDLPDPTLRQVSQEIYKTLQTESLFLATFGSRTLMDRLIVLTVGDKGNFSSGLKALMDDGKLSQHERSILEPILQAGHAAAHRGWAPTKDQFKTILDTVEGLIHRLLVLPKLAEELEEAVPGRGAPIGRAAGSQVTIKDKISAAPKALRVVFDDLDQRLRGLGEDVSVHPQKHYVAFKRKRNFASVQIYNQKKVVRVFLNLDPDMVGIDRAGVRDVRQIGHFGTGDLELTIRSKRDIEDAYDLFRRSYEAS
jgi:predicted transport protein